MPFVAWNCERSLVCQRLDESVRGLANILDAPFLSCAFRRSCCPLLWKANCTASFRKIWPKPKKGSGMTKKVADLLVDVLAEAGVRRIYGVVGDSLNGITDSIRKRNSPEWIHVRHEEVAAFAAGAEAHLTGTLAVCAGSCGPGNMHLINGLYDCQRNRVPVLAIAAHIPSREIGSGYFQETDPKHLFAQCSHY